MGQMVLYPEMKQLSDLFHSSGVKIAIVTNSPRPYAVRVLNYFNLHFDTLVAYHDVIKRKPDTQPYQIAIGKVAPQDGKTVLVFGDRLEDMIPAQKMSLVTCACLWSVEESVKQEFLKMGLDYCFETPAEAYDCFSKMLGKYK